jgi:[histone H3]-lysine4 N-trimethyltransferase ASH1L
MLFDQNMIIDATRGSIARFVNHSCEPNCRMEKWTVGGKPRMALFAGDRGIMTGDELTYDYNFDPFSQKNVQKCRCGSLKCRGVLGPKPKDERKPKADKDVVPSAAGKLAGAKRKIAEILEEGTERWSKKPKLAVPKLAVAAFKKLTTTSSTIKTPPRAQIYSSTRSSPAKGLSRAALVKRPALRAASLSTRGAIARRPSMLRRIVQGASEKVAARPRRVVSRSSASEALIQDRSEASLTRTESMKAKAATLRRNVVRTVRGATGGGERTLRPVLLEDSN